MSIGAAVGAIAFSGSIIAFLKLRGIMSIAPITFPAQHISHLLSISIVALTYFLCGAVIEFVLDFNNHLFFGWSATNNTIGGADMPVVISMLNSYSGWAVG